MWHFPARIFYKTFPCCGAMQNSLAHFHNIVVKRDLQPDDIIEVTVKLTLLAELPVWRSENVVNHIDAQFNVPFVFSAVAHRIEIGPSWQAPETLGDQCITRFMKKVKVVTDLDAGVKERPDVEVVVGKGTDKKVYSEKGVALDYAMSDAELIDKFMRNTRKSLSEYHAQEMITIIQSLENLDDITELFRLATNQ